MGLLIYGLIQAGISLPSDLTGLHAEPVRSLLLGELAALVSECNEPDIAPRRRHLLDYQNLLKRVGEHADIVPMSFGMLADDEEDLRTTLGPSLAAIKRLLGRITGQREFVLRLIWTGENVFAHFVETATELRRLRDRYFMGGRAPTQDEKIHLGKVFEHHLQDQRATILAQLLDVLAASITDYCELGFPSEQHLVNVAMLVPKDTFAALEAKVDVFAAGWPDDYRIELSAPSPPYSFVDRQL